MQRYPRCPRFLPPPRTHPRRGCGRPASLCTCPFVRRLFESTRRSIRSPVEISRLPCAFPSPDVSTFKRSHQHLQRKWKRWRSRIRVPKEAIEIGDARVRARVSTFREFADRARIAGSNGGSVVQLNHLLDRRCLKDRDAGFRRTIKRDKAVCNDNDSLLFHKSQFIDDIDRQSTQISRRVLYIYNYIYIYIYVNFYLN